MLSRPPFYAFLPLGPPRKHGGLAGIHAFAGLGRGAVCEPARESMAHPTQGRPGVLAMVRYGFAARRRTAPMRVRPTDPCRAPWRPYGLGRRRSAADKETQFPFASLITDEGRLPRLWTIRPPSWRVPPLRQPVSPTRKRGLRFEPSFARRANNSFGERLLGGIRFAQQAGDGRVHIRLDLEERPLGADEPGRLKHLHDHLR